MRDCERVAGDGGNGWHQESDEVGNEVPRGTAYRGVQLGWRMRAQAGQSRWRSTSPWWQSLVHWHPQWRRHEGQAKAVLASTS
ncbi:Os08g0218950 [Oryza sativa Japonica Group]|jgi:hypothetical protein|uniref:Os08g0218950 protein n=2 Tax=Oryza sativa subsp. japonica TaxID=39947 RepID=A0A0P0XDF1_ORYSJ|nr:Os08g0218950 [Oryza sativa Japonica Group]